MAFRLFMVCLTISSIALYVRAKAINEAGPLSYDYLLGEYSNFASNKNILFVDHDVPESSIRDIISKGKSVICYVNVGAWENWRADAHTFPEAILGNDYEGWEGERWLDIRNIAVVLPIMERRFEDAVKKGCQGIDPDNMNGYSVDTGFPLTFNDQLIYNQEISRSIRRLGMLAGLKNDNEQATALEPYSDFAVVEECAQYKFCEKFDIFIQKNKPVFVIEYTPYYNAANFTTQVCQGQLGQTRKSFILKHLELRNDFIVSCL